jgi:hypothetical protein
VEALDGDAHEEDAHGDFASDRGEAVGDFAEPPVLRGLVLKLREGTDKDVGRYTAHLHCCYSFVRGQDGEFASGSVDGAADHTPRKHQIERLCLIISTDSAISQRQSSIPSQGPSPHHPSQTP